jgi:outer membrane protein OmpA-like peptidoglycan-associated protein
MIFPLFLFGAGLVTGKTKYVKFEPGDRVLFETDFRNCPVGELPEGFDGYDKPLECVRYDDHIWVAPSTSNGMKIWKKLPIGKEDFSVEYDLLLNPEKRKGAYPKVAFHPMIEKGGDYLGKYDAVCYGDRVRLGGLEHLMDFGAPKAKRLHFAIQVRRHQYRLFVNGKRLASVPFDKSVEGVLFRMWETPAYGALLTNLRVAAYTKKEARPTPEKLGIDVRKTGRGMMLTVPERVLFDFNKFLLKPEAEKALSVVGDFIREHPAKTIIVTGHTDNVGGEAYNLKLSLQRAQSVADYLIYCEKIDPKLFKIVGKGESEPIADNATEEGRAKNRRVEIELAK